MSDRSIFAEAESAMLDAMVDTPEHFAGAVCAAYRHRAWRLVRLLVERRARLERGMSHERIDALDVEL